MLNSFMSRSSIAVAATIALSASGLSAQSKQQGGPALAPALAATRAALERFQDPMQAVREGYFSTVACIEFRKPGAGHTGHHAMDYKPGGMGVHFLNPAYIGPTLDSLKPQVLMYEVVGDKLRLVGAEWFVPVAVSKTPPSIFGQTLQGPMEGHEPIMPTGLHHWDLHVWLWKENPNGVFHPTNAAIRCPASGYRGDDAPPRIVTP